MAAATELLELGDRLEVERFGSVVISGEDASAARQEPWECHRTVGAGPVGIALERRSGASLVTSSHGRFGEIGDEERRRTDAGACQSAGHAANAAA